MRELTHFVGGKHVAGVSGRVCRRVRPEYWAGTGAGAVGERGGGVGRHCQCGGGAAGLGGHQPAAPRAG